ncbi:MAG: hypothetical protein JSV21_02495 [Nitrospirota bacterium]|nr:MAG: hypothetical protein JSV21_02495 [Nitrospirota bacterium]
MKLGIMINSDKNLKAITGIALEAVKRGHQVELFVMDEGTRLLESEEFIKLVESDGLKMTYCKYNVEGLGVNIRGLPAKIISGSQYNNAGMIHSSDKLIML